VAIHPAVSATLVLCGAVLDYGDTAGRRTTRPRAWMPWVAMAAVGPPKCLSQIHCPGPLGHLIMQPASIGMLAPVMYFEASEARNSTSSATSSGSSPSVGNAW
jgi:hypothetical protein